MPRRSAEPLQAAAEPLKTPKHSARTRTTTQYDEEARVLCARWKNSAAAARGAHTNKVGSKAAFRSGFSGGATYNMVEPLLLELRASGNICDDRDHHRKFSPTPSASSRRHGPCTQPVFLDTKPVFLNTEPRAGGPPRRWGMTSPTTAGAT